MSNYLGAMLHASDSHGVAYTAAAVEIANAVQDLGKKECMLVHTGDFPRHEFPYDLDNMEGKLSDELENARKIDIELNAKALSKTKGRVVTVRDNHGRNSDEEIFSELAPNVVYGGIHEIAGRKVYALDRHASGMFYQKDNGTHVKQTGQKVTAKYQGDLSEAKENMKEADYWAMHEIACKGFEGYNGSQDEDLEKIVQETAKESQKPKTILGGHAHQFKYGSVDDTLKVSRACGYSKSPGQNKSVGMTLHMFYDDKTVVYEITQDNVYDLAKMLNEDYDPFTAQLIPINVMGNSTASNNPADNMLRRPTQVMDQQGNSYIALPPMKVFKEALDELKEEDPSFNYELAPTQEGIGLVYPEEYDSLVAQKLGTIQDKKSSSNEEVQEESQEVEFEELQQAA